MGRECKLVKYTKKSRVVSEVAAHDGLKRCVFGEVWTVVVSRDVSMRHQPGQDEDAEESPTRHWVRRRLEGRTTAPTCDGTERSGRIRRESCIDGTGTILGESKSDGRGSDVVMIGARRGAGGMAHPARNVREDRWHELESLGPDGGFMPMMRNRELPTHCALPTADVEGLATGLTGPDRGFASQQEAPDRAEGQVRSVMLMERVEAFAAAFGSASHSGEGAAEAAGGKFTWASG